MCLFNFERFAKDDVFVFDVRLNETYYGEYSVIDENILRDILRMLRSKVCSFPISSVSYFNVIGRSERKAFC